MHKKNIYWFFSLVGMCLLMVCLRLRIVKDHAETLARESTPQNYFAIVPHFVIQPNTIQNFYTFLQTSYRIDKSEPLHIIIISPDHFNVLTGDMAKFCGKKLCYQNICLPIDERKASDELPCIDTENTTEHGIGVQFNFIKKTFPQAKISPIIVQPRKFVGDTQLINEIINQNFLGKTFILASVDFSHYTDEDFAWLHDQKSFYTLNNATGIQDYGSLEVDCPSCLYVVNSLAQQNKQYPQLYLRDSSSTIVGKNLGTGNTSRQFISYSAQKTEANGFTLAFFGDLIFDRQVAQFLSTGTLIENQFKTFFQNEDINLDPQFYPHRKLFGIDFVGLNLETPIVQDAKDCIASHKQVQFCSADIILPYLSELWFNIANVANNHTFDWGTQAHQETIQLLKQSTIQPIGYVRNSTYFQKNYEWKTTIRGIPVAREGFDFTITPRRLFSGYCDILKKNKTEGRISLVSVHRWTEYQTTHDASQESIAKQLIQCGADIIIGTHPHVTQDISRYQGKPIIYSLGNFLFDMKNPPATKIGWYVLIDYRLNGSITLLTGNINASIYK